jgi:hypothetical protein
LIAAMRSSTKENTKISLVHINLFEEAKIKIGNLAKINEIKKR